MSTPGIALKAVCFDCFGTLMQVQSNARAYRTLLEDVPDRASARREVMTLNRTLRGHAHALGVPEQKIPLCESLLAEELGSIALYPETRSVLQALRQKGLKLALCSNLASEFGAQARKLLPQVFTAEVLSYEVGAIKPERAIFEAVLQQLNLSAEEVIMVGDSVPSDIEGARQAGLHAIRIARGAPSLRGSLGCLSDLLSLLKG